MWIMNAARGGIMNYASKLFQKKIWKLLKLARHIVRNRDRIEAVPRSFALIQRRRQRLRRKMETESEQTRQISRFLGEPCEIKTDI